MSAADQPLESDRVAADWVAGMQEELFQVQNNSNAVFFYSFIQASAKVWE